MIKMIKSQGGYFVLLAAFFALCIMAAYYCGYRSAQNGILIRADRESAQNAGGTIDTNDLDRYFEKPEETETSAQTPSGKLININTATIEELDGLPDIGPKTAQKIVEYRECYGNFLTIEELKAVDGIGDGTFQKIKALITVG